MSDDDLGRRLEVASKVAREAGALALRYFNDRGSLSIEAKGRQDLVSEADREVEVLIRRELEAAFPGDAYLGEEGGGAGAERLWVIDPIDGTLNFLRGVPLWAVVIAYVVGGRTQLGVTYDPVHDELWAARRGRGAHLNGRPIRVAPTDRPDRGLAGLTFNFKQPPQPYLDMLGALIRHGMEHRRTGSTAVNLCFVADGRFDAALTLDCSSWDCLAGLIAIEEAGGRATDFVREYGFLGKGGVIAAVPALAGVVEEASGLRFQR